MRWLARTSPTKTGAEAPVTTPLAGESRRAPYPLNQGRSMMGRGYGPADLHTCDWRNAASLRSNDEYGCQQRSQAILTPHIAVP